MLTKTKIIYLSVIGIILLSGLFFKPQFLSFNIENSIKTETLGYRLWAWQSAIKCWWQRPFVGYGLENYIICYNEKFNPKFQMDEESVTWYDRPHNYFLQQLVDTGLFGFTAFLLLLFAIFKTIWKMPKPYKLVVAPILSAYLIHLFFIFPSFVDFMMFILFISFLNNYARISEE